ncbi:hypothetical protein KQI42_12255 [Tissierella sp. MSJ-40]|uniref:Uncharacterized protein n=2 Tax=Tissierella simiarum TaxID=2841534 RepID=A0ABS6E7F6_9FIRM|nr:HTH domain-containing protein [Tissierella simiarum]MBU5438791.1 hypothetical protein [Tissierella simiarum]
MARVDLDWIKDYLDGKKEIFEENQLNENYLKLEYISTFLSGAISLISPDDRVKGIIEYLMEEYNISYNTISLYADIEKEDIEDFMKDANSISYEKKYRLATTSLFLHFLFKKPDC